jgi:glycosyltransferase involved in cell wall biosynthesis
VAIRSGIEPGRFLNDSPGAGDRLRERIRCNKDSFIFGFFGRFEPEKGFNYIIDAVELLKKRDDRIKEIIILAMGSGRYEGEYKMDIESRGLSGWFRFLPFNPDVTDIMKGCSAILMPSTIEAWPMVACEALCSGIPLIATDCVGLRETIENTPTIRIPSQDSEALADAMTLALSHPELGDEFVSFREEAARRFDVKYSAEKLSALFYDVTH